MVPSVSTARVGSGGISIDVTFDTSAAKAKLSDLRNITAQAVRDLKVRPSVDFEETAFVRGLDAAVRRIQKENVKIKIATELDRQGLGQIAREIGVIRDSAVAAASTSPRTNASVRDAQFSHIRSSFGSLGAANAEAAKRAGVEAKLAEGLAAEGAGGGMMGLLKGGGMALAVVKSIEAAVAVGRVAQGIGNAIISNDSINKRSGIVNAIAGAEAVPIIGGVISSFDKLAGVTESLSNAIQSQLNIETRGVEMAQLSRDPMRIASAVAGQNLRNFARKNEHLLRNPYYDPWTVLKGEFTGETELSLADLRGQGVQDAENFRLAGRERTAARRGISTATYVADLQRGRTPLAAQRAALAGQLANDLTLAPDYLKSYTATRNAAVLGNFDFQQAFDIGNLNFQSSTRIGAATLRARNHGVRLADEDALTTIRGLQYNINTASRDTALRQGTTAYSFRDIAVSEAIAEGLALKASLLPRGGAVAGAVNPIGTRIGDPYGIIPEIAARGRAMSFTEGALARWGGAGSGTGFPSAYPVGGGPNSDDKLDLIARLLEDIRDAFGGSYDPGSN